MIPGKYIKIQAEYEHDQLQMHARSEKIEQISKTLKAAAGGAETDIEIEALTTTVDMLRERNPNYGGLSIVEVPEVSGQTSGNLDIAGKLITATVLSDGGLFKIDLHGSAGDHTIGLKCDRSRGQFTLMDPNTGIWLCGTSPLVFFIDLFNMVYRNQWVNGSLRVYKAQDERSSYTALA